MPEQKTFLYDPKKVSVIVGGSALNGFVKDSFVTASYDENAINYSQGLVHGAVVLNSSREGSVSFKLMQTSESNKELQKYASRARARRGVFYFTLLIINNSGGELASADTAWIMKEPNLDLSNPGLRDRTWNIKTGNLTMTFDTEYEVIDGGNPNNP